MDEACRTMAAEKIKEMPVERVMKLLIFMAGMEAEQAAERMHEGG